MSSLLTPSSDVFELFWKLSKMTAMTRLSMTNAHRMQKKQKKMIAPTGCGVHWLVYRSSFRSCQNLSSWS